METKTESFSIDNQTCKSLENKLKLVNIIDYLYFNSHNIDTYSTFEIELLIQYTDFNQKKCLELMDNTIKEDLIKILEEWKFNEQQKEITEKQRRKNIKQSNLQSPISKTEYYTIEIKENKKDLFSNEYPWSFLKNDLNIIDIKDELKYVDQYKLINEAIKIVKDRDNKKLNSFFEKHDDDRNKLIRDIFSKNLELNDVKYLKDNDNFLGIKVDKFYKTDLTSKEEDNKLVKADQFEKYFYKKINSSLKNLIFEYCGFEAIANLLTVNKKMNECINSKFKKEHLSKIYCSAIYKYSNLYLNDLQSLTSQFTNFYDMMKNRPKVRFGGIYYSQVKYTKKADEAIQLNGNNMFTVFNFRFIRFFPNGNVYFLTAPEKKSKALIQKIKSGECCLKEGRFFVENDNVLITMKYNTISDIIYKMFITDIYYDDILYKGLELKSCILREKNGTETEFKFNEFMPKIFRYRRLNILDNACYLKTEFK